MRCPRAAPLHLWRATKLLSVLLAALLLGRYRDQARNAATTAAADHFTRSIAALRPVVEAKRAALEAGECPRCRPGAVPAGAGRPAQRTDHLLQVEGELLRRAGLGDAPRSLPPADALPLRRPPPPAPAAMETPTSPSNAPSAAIVEPAQAPVRPEATPAAPAAPTPPPPAEATPPTIQPQQRDGEGALSLLSRLAPPSQTPRVFLVYAPPAGPKTNGDHSASDLATALLVGTNFCDIATGQAPCFVLAFGLTSLGAVDSGNARRRGCC